ncbi:non-ribosomal peptide synthetase [Streptomyces sp. NPDC059095]|uniref:non-ribosomal peptide synthetase n=1 Tax=Streptomyces sp. NPDC059095 TaxID=3346726 RepID=UPI0036A7BC28
MVKEADVPPEGESPRDSSVKDRPVKGGTVAGDGSVVEALDRAVREFPGHDALRTADTTLTYREFGTRVEEFARRLQDLTAPGEFIAIEGDRGPAAIIAMAGALKAARPFVFVDDRDSASSNAEKTGLLGVRLMARAPSGNGPAEFTPIPEAWRTGDGTPAGARPGAPQLPFQEGEIGYAIHTSGSTGTPKCVLVRAAPLAPVIRDHVERLAVGPDSRTLQFARLTFDGCITEILWTLTAGGCLVVLDEAHLAPGAVLRDTLERFAITHLKTTPFALTVTEPGDAMHLEHVVNGGGPCRPAVIRTWSKVASFHNAYGLTETTVCNLLSDALDPDDCRDGVPLGDLVGDCGHLIREPATGATGPGVQRGELVVTGASVAAGYLTAQGVRPFLGPDGTSAYATGDLVELRADGLHFVERLDRQVKVRGYRLDPGEIEAAVCRHPDVRDAVVVAEAHDEGDPSDRDTLVCYYRGEPGPRSVRAHLEGILDPYKIPSVLEQVDAFPHTVNGKVDRDALRARRRGQATQDAPATPEEQVLRVVRTLTGVEDVRLDDNFFDVGGDSASAVVLVSRLKKLGWADAGVRDVLRAADLGALADRLRERSV